MLLVFFGNDIVRVRKEAYDRVRAYEEEGNDVVRITPETYVEGQLNDLLGAASLFSRNQVIVLDMLSEAETVFDEILAHNKEIAESENIFICIEGPLGASQKKPLLLVAHEQNEYTESEKEKFNSFLLADALSMRDRRTLWLLLMRAWREGLSPEEIIGTLYWQVKMLRLAEKTSSAEEAGQKSFVYGKAKRALKQFKEGELETLSQDLLSMYHDGHLGKRDIDIALERWVLTI